MCWSHGNSFGNSRTGPEESQCSQVNSFRKFRNESALLLGKRSASANPGRASPGCCRKGWVVDPGYDSKPVAAELRKRAIEMITATRCTRTILSRDYSSPIPGCHPARYAMAANAK